MFALRQIDGHTVRCCFSPYSRIANLILYLIAFNTLFAAVIYLGGGISGNLNPKIRRPDSIHVIIISFVCSNLCDGILRTIYYRCVLLAVPLEEIRTCAALCLGPSFERVSSPSRNTFAFVKSIDCYWFVNPELMMIITSCRIGMQQRSFSIIISTIVAVPIDMGRVYFFGIFIFSPDLNRVGVVFSRIKILRIYNCLCASKRDSCVALQCCKSLARKDFNICIYKFGAVPFLYNPAIKELVFRRC